MDRRVIELFTLSITTLEKLSKRSSFLKKAGKLQCFFLHLSCRDIYLLRSRLVLISGEGKEGDQRETNALLHRHEWLRSTEPDFELDPDSSRWSSRYLHFRCSRCKLAWKIESEQWPKSLLAKHRPNLNTSQPNSNSNKNNHATTKSEKFKKTKF